MRRRTMFADPGGRSALRAASKHNPRDQPPVKRLRRRVRASAAWRAMAALDQQVNAASTYKARAAIIEELSLSAYEIEMADHHSLLPIRGV